MNNDAIIAKQKELSDRFDAKAAERDKLHEQVAAIENELKQLQGAYNVLDEMKTDDSKNVISPATIVAEPKEEKSGKSK